MSGDARRSDVLPGDSTGRPSQAHGGESDAEEAGATEAAAPASASGSRHDARHTADTTAAASQNFAAGDTTEPLKTCNLCQLEFPRSQFKMLSGGRTASYCTPCTSLVCRCEPQVTIRALPWCTVLASVIHASPPLHEMHYVQPKLPMLRKLCILC